MLNVFKKEWLHRIPIALNATDNQYTYPENRQSYINGNHTNKMRQKKSAA